MTAQASERLIYKGKEVSITAEPLRTYLQHRKDISFLSPSSDCWRGYYGRWELRNNRLYLIDLKGYTAPFKEVGLSHLFPNEEAVFAKWFSGEIRIPQGRLLEYVHQSHASVYEKDVFLVFEEGVLTRQYETDNAAAN